MTVHENTAALDDRQIVPAAPALGELKEAFAAIDVCDLGFEMSVRVVCEASGAAFLFDLPTIGDDDISRVAALAWVDENEEPIVAFAALDADGETVSVDRKCPSMTHAEAIADAYFDLLLQ